MDRITSLAFPDARGDTTYTYTPDGLQAQLSVTNFTNNLVKTTYAYNTRRLLAQETMQWDLITWPVTYGYDKYGHVLQQTYPGPLTVNYAPNALGQATQAGTYATGVTYFPNGAIASFDYGNGITHTLTQNARQLPMRSKDAFGDSTTYLDDSYDYDQNGNVLAISDGLSGARGNRDMTYDNLDRLTSVKSLMYSSTATAGTIYIGYDALDNITTVSAWNRSQRYCYDTAKNQLTFIRTPANSTCPNGGAATTALSYDVQGNVSSKNNNVYAFDFGNRLRSATDGTTTTTYVYDALGRRVRDITGSSRYSLYTQAGQIAYTSDARKNEATNYIYLGGSLVATSRLPTGSSTPIVEYQHTDALGTPVVVTNSSRGILEKSEYEPYGSVLNRQKHDGPGFTGHVEDAATGLTYMQQRYYDPAVGRFLSVDPVTAYTNPVGAFNRYWYANNNPYLFTDPDGRVTIPWQEVGRIAAKGGARAGAAAISDGPEPFIGDAIGLGILIYTAGEIGYTIYQANSSEGGPSSPQYPANPDDWAPPDGWTETNAGEKTDGKHRQWIDQDGRIRRRWDREGRENGKERGPHWHDSDDESGGKDHIEPDDIPEPDETPDPDRAE